MPRYGNRSERVLATVEPMLGTVMRHVIEWFDHSILVGHRNQSEQNRAFGDGRSRLPWPQSSHNSKPSFAVDAAPYSPGKGVDWLIPKFAKLKQTDPELYARIRNYGRYCYFAGAVMATGRELGVKLRWGGDWDGDTDLADQTFDDLVHFERRKP